MNSSNQQLLYSNGFIVIKNILTNEEIDFVLNAYNSSNNKLNYKNIEFFIRNIMLKKINNFLSWNSDFVEYIKYRFSNNNNSTDAGGFHRDIVYHGDINNYDKYFCPTFTCLTYLDNTKMEIIPGSHKVVKYNFNDVNKKYNKKNTIQLSRGDLLVFYSTLLHRGIFTEKLPNRRLLQVFDVFNSRNQYNFYKDYLYNFNYINNNIYQKLLIKINKNDNFILSFINYYIYINSAMGYGIKYDIVQKLNINKPFIYISSEGTVSRLHTNELDNNSFGPINKYVLNNNYKVLDMPEDILSNYYYYAYIKNNVELLLLLLLFVISITLLSIYIYKKIKKHTTVKKLR